MGNALSIASAKLFFNIYVANFKYIQYKKTEICLRGFMIL